MPYETSEVFMLMSKKSEGHPYEVITAQEPLNRPAAS
jgi:hypothetical protein